MPKPGPPNPDCIERLIALVASNPSLYQRSHRHYKDLTLKEGIWRSIAQELGTDIDEAQKKWKSVRDTYNRRLREQRDAERYGLDMASSMPYKYEKQLEFLVPHLKNRSSLCNITPVMRIKTENDSFTQEDGKAEDWQSCDGTDADDFIGRLHGVYHEAPPPLVRFPVRQRAEGRRASGASHPVAQPPSPSPEDHSPAKRRRLTSESSESEMSRLSPSVLMTTDQRESKQPSTRGRDDVEMWLLSFVPVLRSLSEYQLWNIKSRFTTMVMDVKFGPQEEPPHVQTEHAHWKC